MCAITGVYLLRGFASLPLLLFARSKATPFLVWSSLVCIGFGLVHLLGVLQVWPQLRGTGLNCVAESGQPAALHFDGGAPTP